MEAELVGPAPTAPRARARVGRRWLAALEPVRVRITLAATLAFGLAFAGASVALVHTVRHSLEARQHADTSRAAQRLVATKAFQRKLAELRRAPLVNYAGVGTLKAHVLERIFRDAKPAASPPSTFAIYEALREEHGGSWERWPREYRQPDSAALRKFAKRRAQRIAFHDWVQSAARAQLEAVQRRAHELGMPIGLYVDLALGADRAGAEVWADQASYALEATCGAPPDEFNPAGQDWGLPPYSPRALQASGYRAFRELLRANMPEAARCAWTT